MKLGYICVGIKTSCLMSFRLPPGFIPVPGSHHVIHIVGPPGANGTQQFPKLSDCDLVCILNPLIVEHIINKYCKKDGKDKNARCILANLRPIVKCATAIFKKIEEEHGSCSCECIGAMQRNQAAQGQLCDLVYRALRVCFTFADLLIQLDKINNKSEPEAEASRKASTPTPKEASEEKIKKLISRWDQLQKEIGELQKTIHRELDPQ